MLTGTALGANIYALIVNILCAVNNVFFLVYTLYRLKTTEAFKDYKSGNNVLYLTIGTISVFCIQSIASVFDPIYKLQGNESGSSGVSIIQALAYVIGKFLVYILFIRRLNYVFQDSLFPYPQSTIRAIYFLLVGEFLGIIIALIGYIHDEGEEDKAKWDNALLYIGGVVYFLLDITFCIILPYLFVRKLYFLVPSKVRREEDDKTAQLTIQHSQHDKSENQSYKDDNNTVTNNQSVAHTANREATTTSGNDAANIAAHIELSTHHDQDQSTNNNKPEKSGDSGSNSGRGIRPSVPSVPNLGITSADAPVQQDPNEYKYNALLNTASRLTLLSTITLSSSIILLVLFFVLIAGADDSRKPFGEVCSRIDGAINVVCIALCFKWSDDLYNILCKSCHSYFQQKKCCACLCNDKN